MKNLMFVCLFLLATSYSFSQYYIYGPHFVAIDQYQTLDSAFLKVSYQMIHVRDKGNAQMSRETDNQTLLIGNSITKYFSQEFIDSCEMAKDGMHYRLKNPGVATFEIFKNYPYKKTTVTEIGGEFFIGGTFKYEETLPSFDWQITEDTATILTYPCLKARTNFRGRTYEAWFTQEIPVDNGPWKFAGLPGLILKVNDAKLEVVFQCVSIEKLSELMPIKLYDFKYRPSSRSDIDKLFRRFLENPVMYMRSIGSEAAEQLDPSDFPKIPYNPIELK